MTQEQEAHGCRLYLISPPKIELSRFAVALKEALSGGDVGAFQLRLKECDDASILEAAETLIPICREAGVAFILNDRVDLAQQLDVDGVHIGQEDGTVAEARHALGADAVIGVTCHASGHFAMEAGDAGADYVAFGAFFPTTSKPMEKQEQYGRPEPELLSWWATYTILPCVAIGGMTPANCGTLVTAGADFIAVITAVWDHPKGPKVAVSEFNAAIRAGMKARDMMPQEAIA